MRLSQHEMTRSLQIGNIVRASALALVAVALLVCPSTVRSTADVPEGTRLPIVTTWYVCAGAMASLLLLAGAIVRETVMMGPRRMFPSTLWVSAPVEGLLSAVGALLVGGAAFELISVPVESVARYGKPDTQLWAGGLLLVIGLVTMCWRPVYVIDAQHRGLQKFLVASYLPLRRSVPGALRLQILDVSLERAAYGQVGTVWELRARQDRGVDLVLDRLSGSTPRDVVYARAEALRAELGLDAS